MPPPNELEVFTLSSGAGSFPVISDFLFYLHLLWSPPGFLCGISQPVIVLVTTPLNHHVYFTPTPPLPLPHSTSFPAQTEATRTHLPGEKLNGITTWKNSIHTFIK